MISFTTDMKESYKRYRYTCKLTCRDKLLQGERSYNKNVD